MSTTKAQQPSTETALTEKPLAAKASLRSRKVSGIVLIGLLLVIGIIGVSAFAQQSRRTAASSSYQRIHDAATPMPTPTPTPQLYEMAVDGFMTTNIAVTLGDYVWVQAAGEVLMGLVIGDVGADGNSGLLWEGYKMVDAIPYGALMCRVAGQPWTFCGADYEWKASASGLLELAINDKTVGTKHFADAFAVTVVVSPYSVRSRMLSTATTGGNNSTNSTQTEFSSQDDQWYPQTASECYAGQAQHGGDWAPICQDLANQERAQRELDERAWATEAFPTPWSAQQP